jgi:signal transduction histidine kinase
MRSAATRAVESTMFRALAVLRFIVLANAVGLFVYRHDAYPRPVLGAWIMALLAVWTAAAVWAYDDPRRRTAGLLVADLAVAVAAMVATIWVKGADFNATLPGFWVSGVVLAWAIHWKLAGGLVVAGVVGVTDVVLRSEIDQTNYANIFLIVLGGAIVGYLCALLERASEERDRAERAAAAAVERQRLGRIVHDGVLQVLALVQRRGAEIGGEAAELARLAGEQEASLRAFVQHDAEPDVDLDGELDLAAELGRQASAQVSVALPQQPVLLPAQRAHEVCAVVAACLSNVRHHVGRDAPAWVLLEDEGAGVGVSVRDDGPGIPAGRLDAAAGEGRLGVAQSIRGRVEDLGGSATLTTAPGQGTEWEFRLPRAEPA